MLEKRERNWKAFEVLRRGTTCYMHLELPSSDQLVQEPVLLLRTGMHVRLL